MAKSCTLFQLNSLTERSKTKDLIYVRDYSNLLFDEASIIEGSVGGRRWGRFSISYLTKGNLLFLSFSFSTITFVPLHPDGDDILSLFVLV